jgi:hypothetical protein
VIVGWLGKLLSPRESEGEIAELIAAYLYEHCEHYWDVQPRKMPSGIKLLALPPAEQVRAIKLTLQNELDTGSTEAQWIQRHKREKLVSEMCRRALPFTPDDARAVFALCADLQAHSVHWVRYKSLAKSVARAAEAGGWLASLRPDLEQLRDVLARSRSAQSAECRKLVKELDLLAAQAAGQPASAFRIEHDVWGEKAIAALEPMDGDLRSRWQAVLSYCAAAKGAAPSARWLKTGEEAIGALGKDRFAALACEWLRLLPGPGPKKDATPEEQREFILSEGNGDALKGMAWLLVHVPEEPVAAALGDAASAAFRKIPNFGARSVKVGNACLHTLKNLPGLLGARQLAVLRAAVKLPSQAAAVEKALAECSERLQMTLDETEELATPDHGFVNGARTVKFGDVAAELAIDGTSVVVTWRNAGKTQKTEPAQVKRDFPEERKALKRLVGDVEKTLAALRERLERLPLNLREWPLDVWRSRYIEHPIAGALARRLIWTFRGAAGDRSGAWIGGQWRDESGAVVEVAGTTVLPWHPVFASAESVRNWRALLSAHGIEQPFKQAHREIYLITDAERNTGTYSNRFAAHVLRQHQFASLCAARGWKYRLQGGFDSHNYPLLSLPQWRLSAEYWVDSPGDAAGLSPSGIYLHVLTDQVRFLPLDPEPGARAEPLRLEQIPPLVFSEVMRDVDLFVGVTSVGNDPTWHDGGPGGHFRTYWESYSFGELSVFAESRRQTLAELLPRLTALRDVARIDGKFLLVKGTRRDYKIHLGSGNILMSPNDQYLCIVADRSQKSSDLRLPFEGDTLLGVILSKAFLLARDDQIKDPTIVRQIEQATR